MLGSSLPPVVCRRAHVLFTLFVFVWDLQHILSCVFVLLVIRLVSHMVSIPLEWQFFIAPSVFSNVHLHSSRNNFHGHHHELVEDHTIFIFQITAGPFPLLLWCRRFLSHNTYNTDLTWLWIPRRVYYKKHELFTLVEHLSSHLTWVTFSSDAKWNIHVENILLNIYKHLNVLRKSKYKLSRKNLEKLYLVYIRPIFEYPHYPTVYGLGVTLGLWCLSHFQQYFSYILAVSFVGGSIRWMPPPAASHSQTLSHNVVSSTTRHERGWNSQLLWW